MKSPTVTFRIAPLLLASVQAEIARHNKNPILEPHDMTSWVNSAISEKLSHAARSRKKRRKKRPDPKAGQGLED